MPIAEDSAGGSPVPIPTNLTTNLTGEATGSGTLDYTTGDIDIAVTVVDNGHNHILSNITDVQVNNAISGQILVYNGTVWANATNTAGITAIVQDLTPQLGGNLDLNGKNINGNGNINLADNYKLTLGTGNDLELSHDGVSSYIRDVGAGDLQIFASDDVYIRGQGTNTYMARFNESGAVTLYHNNVVRLITTDSGITVTDEVEAAEFIGKLRGPTKFKSQAGEALSAGDPVYISGISGNITVVSKADANDANKMPAFGIIETSVSANASCQVLTFGEMHNLDTSAFSEGNELYVSNTGTLTTTIPSGESSQIQKIAKVTRSHASVGSIFIMGAGRSNAVPNLDNGDIFIGDGTNHATTTSLNTAVNALTLTNYLPLSGGAMTGNITTSGTFDGRNVSVDGAKLDGIEAGADVTLNEISAGTNVTISAGGVISSTASGGLAHVVDDTTPQLGGNLSLNSHDITGTGNLNFTGNVTLSGTVDGRDVASDGTKLDGIEASADVTDTANVTAAGALMDSEVTNLAQVKAFDSSDYATSAQGTTADAALPKAGGTMTGKLTLSSADPEIFLTDTTTGVDHSIDGNSGIGNLFINVDKNNEGSDPKFIVNVGATDDLIVATETGFVGIGAPSPDNRLHIFDNNSDISMDSSASGQLHIDGNGYGFGIALDADAANIYTNSATRDLVFGVNETEVARVKPEGLDVTGAIDVANGTTYTTTGDFLAKVQQNSNSTGKNGLSVMNAWASSTSTIFEAAMGWNGSAAGYYPVFTIDGLGKTTWQDNAGNVRATIDGSGLDVYGAIDVSTSGASNTSKGLAIATSGTNFESDGGIISIDHAASGAVTGGYFSKYSAGGTLRHSVKGDGKGYFAGGLDVTGATNTTGTSNTRQWSAGSAGQKLGIYSYENSTFYHRLETGNATNYQWGTYDNIPIYTITNNSIKTTLLGNGNFGVGVTSPAYKVDVRGDANTDVAIQVKASGTGDVDADLRLDAADTGESVLRMMRDGVTKARVEFTSNELNITTDASGSHIDMQPDGTRVMRFESDNIEAVKVITCERSGVSESTMISFENDNGQVGKITSSGLGTVYGTTSDYRLKTDAQPMLNSIDRIKTLNPINFEWISDGSRVDGFLAHELQSIVPEAVIGTHDGMQDEEYVVSEATGDIYTPAVEATYDEQDQMLTPAVDEIIHSTDALRPDEYKEGQTWRETTERIMATRQVPDYQNIDQSKLVPLLTSALQDAIAKIEALETRLEALES